MDAATIQKIEAKAKEMVTASQVIYYGVFFDENEIKKLVEQLAPGKRLSNIVKNPHITFGFKKEMSDNFRSHIGGKYDLTRKIIGYGNDGKNEGFLVEISDFERKMDDIQGERSYNNFNC